MPATSIAQRKAMAIAEHNPSKLYSKDKSMLNMTGQQQHDYASTPQTGLPQIAGKKKGFKL